MHELLAHQAYLAQAINRTLASFQKTGKTQLTPSRVRSRLDLLDSLWKEFKTGHVALSIKLTPAQQQETPYFAEDQHEAIEEVYFSTRGHIAEVLEQLEPRVSRDTFTASLTDQGSDAPPIAPLVPVTLPPFDGTRDRWECFRDAFTQLVLENPRLTDLTRLHYLRSALSGPALDAVDLLAFKGDNLAAAWRALTQRFENKQLILNDHLTRLHNLEHAKPGSAAALHALVSTARAIISALGNLGRTPDELWQDVLVYLVSRKLDQATRRDWHIQTPSNHLPSFGDLTTFCEDRARAMDLLDEAAPKLAAPRTTRPRVHSGSFAASQAHATSPEPRRSSLRAAKWRSQSCPRCTGSHRLIQCDEYLADSPSRRRAFLIRANRCPNCLCAGHALADCRRSFRCRWCQQKHHSTLHDDSEDSAKPSPPAANERRPPSPNAITPPSHTLAAGRRSPQLALLATAWVKITLPSGRSASVRAVIDPGSQVSIISENMAQLLRAKRSRQPVALSGVGCAASGVARQSAAIRVVSLRPDRRVLNVNALVLPKLTSYTPMRRVSPSSFAYLRDLQWADRDPTSQEPIHLLLGADQYSELILPGVKRGPPGHPVAQNTIFGWIISGPACSPSPRRAPKTVTAQTDIIPSAVTEAISRFWEN